MSEERSTTAGVVRKRRFVKSIPSLAATVVIAILLTTSATAQEQQHEYSYLFDGALKTGTRSRVRVGARTYQLERRYERLIYRKELFAVRWVVDVVPGTLVGDPHTHDRHRAMPTVSGAVLSAHK